MAGIYFERSNASTPLKPHISKQRHNLSNAPHYHDDIELIRVLSGSVTIIFPDRTVKAVQGDIIVVMPGEAHSYSTFDENIVDVMKFYSHNPDRTIKRSTYTFEGTLIKRGTELYQNISTCIEKMLESDNPETNESAYALSAYANMIVHLILNSAECKKIDKTVESYNEKSYIIENKVNSYIAQHYHQPISLESIASHCCMSKHYFAHIFKKATGATFTSYLTTFRINRALKLLSETNKSIAEISHAVGFSTLQMFNHAFKAKTGMTPSEYRKSF